MHLGTTAPISVLFDSFYQGRAVDGNDGRTGNGIDEEKILHNTLQNPPPFFLTLLFYSPLFYQVELASEISVGVLSKEREEWFLP